jgi:hypothetical protein
MPVFRQLGHTSFSIHCSRIISKTCALNWAFSSPELRHNQSDLPALDAARRTDIDGMDRTHRVFAIAFAFRLRLGD